MRWILWLLPRGFRRRFGEDLTAVASELAREARAAGGRRAQLAWLARELASFARLTVSLRRRPARHAFSDLPERSTPMLDSVRSDLRWAFRYGARRPLFAVAVAATLAVCIATASTAFGLAAAVLWRPLPYEDPERLVFVWEAVDREGERQPFRVTGSRFAEWRDVSRSFESVALFGAAGFSMEGPDGVVPVRGVRASANFFDTLRISPAIGRAFLPDDEQPGNDGVVVLSHALWQQRFGGVRGIVGKAVRLSGRPYTVIGVMPPIAFPGWPVNPAEVTIDAASRELWVPIPRTPELDHASRSHVFGVVGRLASGISLEQADSELNASSSPSSADPHGARLTPFREQFVSDTRQPLLALFGAAMAVILVACANLAALYIAAFENRRAELAMRAAIGATARRLARQLATESLLLAAAGGAAGVLLARVALARVPELLPPNVPLLTPASLDVRVALFAIALTGAAGVLLAAWPIRRLFAGGLAARAAARPQRGVYGMLLTGQVGVTVALAASAALLVQSLASVRSRDPGFVVDSVVVAGVALPGERYDKPEAVVAFEERLLARLAAHGDVSAAATAYDHPLEANWSDTYTVSGGMPGSSDAEGQAQLRIVSPRYFTSLGVEVLEGRAFDEKQTPAGAAGTALVNEAFDRALGGGSVGRRLRSAAARLTWGADAPAEFEIVGVVENERFRGLEEPAQPAIYLSTRDFPQTSVALLVRARGGTRAVAADLRTMIREIEPGASVGMPTTLRAMLSDQLATRRITADTIGGFAAVALALAALGLYGLVAMLVSRRTREIGVRLALGASPAGVRRSVLQDGLRPAVAGSLLGVGLALVAGKLIETLLVGVSPGDPLTLGAVVGVLLLVGAIGCLAPAIRASRIDPARTLRAE